MIHYSILKHFFSSNAILQCVPFGAGHINDTYKITLKNEPQPYILQRINTAIFRKPQAIMENINQIATHLRSKQDYPLEILEAVKGLDGTTLFEHEQHYWRVFPWIKNSFGYEVITDPSQAYEAVRGFAFFTNALLDLSPALIQDTLPDFKNNALRVTQFERAILKNREQRVETCLPEIEFIKKQMPWLHELNTLLPSLPRRIVHLDTKLNNVLMDADTLRALCVIDLDTVMEGYIFDDFGDMVRTACNPCAEDETDTSKIKFNHPIYTALRKGYLEILEKSLTKPEIDSLFLGTKVVIWVQAMRFLTDYLEGDVYYKTTYSTHNLVRAKGQIALVKQLNATDR